MLFLHKPNRSCNDNWKRAYQAPEVQCSGSHFIPLLYLCSGGVRQIFWQHMIHSELNTPPIAGNGHFCHYLLSPALCAGRGKSTTSSKPCSTSFCNDTWVTCVCMNKLALNRAELSVRWSKCSLLTLGSLTQETCDLLCWVALRNDECLWIGEQKDYQHCAGLMISVALTLFMALNKNKNCEARSLAGYK